MKKNRNLILIILLISLGINIYLSVSNKNYEYRLGENSYKNIEIIRIKNAKNLEILNGILESNKANNGQLLNLYINYKIIDEAFIDLIGDYSYYKENKVFDINNKNIDNLNVLENDVYGRITIYLENILLNILNTNQNELLIEGKNLEDFNVLDKLSEETNSCYKNLNESKLKGLEGKDKLDKSIDKKYWIDMIDELNSVNSKYNDYDFVSEVKIAKIS